MSLDLLWVSVFAMRKTKRWTLLFISFCLLLREEKRREEWKKRERDSNAGLALSESRCQSRSDLFMRRYERVKVCEGVRERARERERERVLLAKIQGTDQPWICAPFFFLSFSYLLFSFLLVRIQKSLNVVAMEGGGWGKGTSTLDGIIPRLFESLFCSFVLSLCFFFSLSFLSDCDVFQLKPVFLQYNI